MYVRHPSTMRMKPFQVLEHTADVGFEAFGATLEKVFENAALALVNLMVDPATIRLRESLILRADGSSRESLLVNWLSEILYQFDTEGWLFRRFHLRWEGEQTLEATCQGERFDPTRHQAKTLVKAVTYYRLALEQKGDAWRAEIFVDI